MSDDRIKTDGTPVRILDSSPTHVAWQYVPVVASSMTIKAYLVGVRADGQGLRSAMAAMSNVMRCVHDLLVHVRDMQTFYQQEQAHDFRVLRDNDRSLASAEWSRRVRAGVATLPKPGPVVCCQGDYDDE